MNARDGQVKAGDRVFAANAAIDYDALILRFMDHYLRGIDNGVDREPPVRRVRHGRGRVARRGVLAAGLGSSSHPLSARRGRKRGGAAPARPGPARPVPTAASRFVSDPLEPVIDPFALAPGAHDYRDLRRAQDVLVFETEPFDSSLRVLGPIRAQIYVSTDARDTDLWLKLFDVAADGTAWNLMSPGLDVLRASYRGGGPRRELLEPGQVYALSFDEMLTGNLLHEGPPPAARGLLHVLSALLQEPPHRRARHGGESDAQGGDPHPSRPRPSVFADACPSCRSV